MVPILFDFIKVLFYDFSLIILFSLYFSYLLILLFFQSFFWRKYCIAHESHSIPEILCVYDTASLACAKTEFSFKKKMPENGFHPHSCLETGTGLVLYPFIDILV